jgi:hypothetical protein
MRAACCHSTQLLPRLLLTQPPHHKHLITMAVAVCQSTAGPDHHAMLASHENAHLFVAPLAHKPFFIMPLQHTQSADEKMHRYAGQGSCIRQCPQTATPQYLILNHNVISAPRPAATHYPHSLCSPFPENIMPFAGFERAYLKSQPLSRRPSKLRITTIQFLLVIHSINCCL